MARLHMMTKITIFYAVFIARNHIHEILENNKSKAQ